jgi:beta-phosphoglucomutase
MNKLNYQPLKHIKSLIDQTKIAFFDFDGVIADTEPVHALSYQRVLHDYDAEFDPSTFARYVGVKETETYSLIGKERGITINCEEAMQNRMKYFLEIAEDQGLEPFPFIPPILVSLAGLNHPCCIVSSQRPALIKILLDQWALREFFSDIFTVYDSDELNNKVDILSSLAQSAHCRSSDILYFEDSFDPIDYATKHGMRTVGVLHSLNVSTLLNAGVLIDSRDSPA